MADGAVRTNWMTMRRGLYSCFVGTNWNNTGKYTKIGDMVTFSVRIFNNITSSSN